MRQAIQSAWPTPCHDAKSCSSQPWASRHMSGPRTRNKHPILWFKSVSLRYDKQTASRLTKVGGTAGLDNLALSFQSVHLSSVGPGIWGRTLVLPWKMMGSWPGPSEYANVHTAWASLFSNPARSLWNCLTPSDCMNHLLDGETLSLRTQRLELRGSLHIWAREFVPSVKAQACVFYKHRATNLDESELNKSSVHSLP